MGGGSVGLERSARVGPKGIGGKIVDFIGISSLIGVILGLLLSIWGAFRRLHLVKISVRPVLSDNFGTSKTIDWAAEGSTIKSFLDTFEPSYGADPQLFLRVRLTNRGQTPLNIERVEFYDGKRGQIAYQQQASGQARILSIDGYDFAEWSFYLDDRGIEESIAQRIKEGASLRLRFVKGSGGRIRKLRRLPGKEARDLLACFSEEKDRWIKQQNQPKIIAPPSDLA